VGGGGGGGGGAPGGRGGRGDAVTAEKAAEDLRALLREARVRVAAERHRRSDALRKHTKRNLRRAASRRA